MSTSSVQESSARATPHTAMDAPSTPLPQQPQAGWRRWIVLFLALQVLVLGCIAALNYVVNPLGYFATHRFSPMVWNGREEKIIALAAERPKPQVLVLGSSRVWTIAPSNLAEQTGLPSFNAGVSVAMAEDNYALLRYTVEQAHITPKLVIIGLDLESLHNARPVDQRTQDVPELQSYLPRASLAADVTRYKSLLMAPTLQLSLRSLNLARRGKNQTPPDPIYTVGQHGDTQLSGVLRRLANGQSTVAAETQETIVTYSRRYIGYTALSSERLNYLRLTLVYCAQRNIKAVVYLSPLSTVVQTALAPFHYQDLHRAALVQVPQITQASGAAFLDYTDAASFGGLQTGFLDGTHMSQPAGAIMISRLLQDTHLLPSK